MTCTEELTEKLAQLGLHPLPAHFIPYLKAVCEGKPTDALAMFIYRWHAWPRRALNLARRWAISDEEYDELLALYLAEGESGRFLKRAAEIEAATARRSHGSGESFEIKSARAKRSAALVDIRESQAESFEILLREEFARNSYSFERDAEIEELKEQYAAGSKTVQDVQDILAAKGRNAPKPQ